MREIRLSDDALADIEAIRDTIAEANPVAAEAVIRRIFDVLRVIRAHPDAGAPRPRLGRHVRCAIAHPYLAFYEPDGEALLVLCVLHGARRIARALLREP